MLAASRSFAECRRDDQTSRPDVDGVETRGKKRTLLDMESHSNKCSLDDCSSSHDNVAAIDVDDDRTARCDVAGLVEVFSSDDAQTEMTTNDTRALVAEVNSHPTDLLPVKLSRCSESHFSDAVTLSSNIYKTTDDVTMTSSNLPLPEISSTSYSEGPLSSGSQCSNVATTTTTTTYCDGITLTSSKLLPVVPLITKTVCKGTTTFASSETSPVGTVSLFPHAPTSTRVGSVLHSSAGLLPFPGPMTISQQAPFVVARSVRPPIVRLGAPRWLPVPQVTPGHQYPTIRLISPTAFPTDYFRKQHVTGTYGLGSAQIRYYVAASGDCRGLSSIAFQQPNSTEVAPQAPDGSQLPRLLPRSSLVGPPQRPATCESSQPSTQSSPVDRKSAAASDDVIAKLDPVSRAVYDNFLGKLRTTTGPKTRTGRRRGHVNDVTRRYRN